MQWILRIVCIGIFLTSFLRPVHAQTSISDIQIPIYEEFSKSFNRIEKEDYFLEPNLVNYIKDDKKKLKPKAEKIALPGLSVSVPSGFGANFGTVFGGATLVDRVRFGGQTDAVVAFGFGAGNSKKFVGLSTVIGIYDLKDEFANDGAFSFKIHRQLGDGTWAIAVGVLDGLIWGPNINSAAHYIVASKFIPLKKSVDEWFYGMLINTGIGTERFVPSLDTLAEVRGDPDKRFSHWGAFGSVGIGIIRPLSISAAWSGYNVDIGMSIAPFRNRNLIASFTAQELLQGGNGDGVRYSYSLSYSYTFDFEAKK